MRLKKFMVKAAVMALVLVIGILLGLDLGQFRSANTQQSEMAVIKQENSTSQETQSDKQGKVSSEDNLTGLTEDHLSDDPIVNYAEDRKASRERLIAQYIPMANSADRTEQERNLQKNDMSHVDSQENRSPSVNQDGVKIVASDTKIDKVANTIGSLLQVTADKGVRQVVSVVDKLLN